VGAILVDCPSLYCRGDHFLCSNQVGIDPLSIFENLKKTPAAERIVSLGSETVLVRGLKRSQKNELQNEATSSRGKLNGVKYEGLLLAACCLDPKTNDPIQPDYREWDLPQHLCGPLVSAIIEVNGLDDEEAKTLVKKSDTTES
jgi:hypothetical protein